MNYESILGLAASPSVEVGQGKGSKNKVGEGKVTTSQLKHMYEIYVHVKRDRKHILGFK